MNIVLWVWALAVACWRLTFKAVPVALSSAGLCRDAGHFLLGALGCIWVQDLGLHYSMYRFNRRGSVLASAWFALSVVAVSPPFVVFWALTVLEGVMFALYGSV